MSQNRVDIAILKVEVKALKEISQLQVKGNENAIVLARDEMSRRLDGMNEFRRQIENAELKFLPRTEWQAGHDAIEYRVRNTEDLSQEIKNTALGPDYAKMMDGRFRAVERLIWMATGAVIIIVFVVNWFRR